MHKSASLTTSETGETHLLPEEKKWLGQLAKAFVFPTNRTATHIDLILGAIGSRSSDGLGLPLEEHIYASKEAGLADPSHGDFNAQNTPDLECALSEYWYWEKL